MSTKFNRFKKEKGVILIVLFLCITLSTYTQNQKHFSFYKIKLDIGSRIKPAYSFGGMVGLSFQNKEKPFGLNLRMNFMPHIGYTSGYGCFVDEFVYIDYFEFTYKIFYFKGMPFRFGTGIAKPSFTFNVFKNCPYCFANNLTLSIQQQIKWFNVEVRIDTSIGDRYWGWYFPKSCYFSLGINYAFELKLMSKRLFWF